MVGAEIQVGEKHAILQSQPGAQRQGWRRLMHRVGALSELKNWSKILALTHAIDTD